MFTDGLALLVAQLVYTLPFWLLACIVFFATVGFGGLSEVNEDVAAAGILATFGLVGCLSLIFWIALLFISPAIVIQYVKTNELGACFRFGEVIAIARDNLNDIVIAVLATFAASLVLGVVLSVLGVIPCLGQIAGAVIGIAAGPYLLAITGHLYGQIAANIEGKAAKFG